MKFNFCIEHQKKNDITFFQKGKYKSANYKHEGSMGREGNRFNYSKLIFFFLISKVNFVAIQLSPHRRFWLSQVHFENNHSNYFLQQKR